MWVTIIHIQNHKNITIGAYIKIFILGRGGRAF